MVAGEIEHVLCLTMVLWFARRAHDQLLVKGKDREREPKMVDFLHGAEQHAFLGL